MRWHVNCLNIYDIDKNKLFFVICVVEWFMDYELNNMNLVIFTDIDGTFMGNDNFEHAENIELANKLVDAKHFVIFNSSKTYYEIDNMFKNEASFFPFICETGGGIYSPKNIFVDCETTRESYDVIYESTMLFSYYEKIKKILMNSYANDLIFFDDLDIKDQIKVSGLEGKNLTLASRRDFTILFIWKSSDTKFRELEEVLEIHNLSIIRGGRFCHICSKFNKGIAMKIFMDKLMSISRDRIFNTVAIGDSSNDLEMLKVADYPCVVKSDNNKRLAKHFSMENIITSDNEAPTGWQECIDKVFNAVRS